MPRTCTICIHPDREAIEQALTKRTPLRAIANRWSVSKSALIRHNRDHFPESPMRTSNAVSSPSVPTSIGTHRTDVLPAVPPPEPEHFSQIEHPLKRAFLAAYTKTATVRGAAAAAGISNVSHYYWLRDDPEYAKAFLVAKAVAARELEDEATRRAMGWAEPVYDNDGNVVGERKRYSDTLLIVRLKAALGDEYREKSTIEHDLSPAMATLMATWQELRAHPERAHGPVPGTGEAMLQLGEHADWMDAEIEDSSPSAGEVGDELAPDWQAEQQAFQVARDET